MNRNLCNIYAETLSGDFYRATFCADRIEKCHMRMFVRILTKGFRKVEVTDFTTGVLLYSHYEDEDIFTPLYGIAETLCKIEELQCELNMGE